RHPPRPLGHHRPAAPGTLRVRHRRPRRLTMAPHPHPQPLPDQDGPGIPPRPEIGPDSGSASLPGPGAGPTDDDSLDIARRRLGSGTELTTVAMRRYSAAGRNSVFTMLQELGIQVLPNTAGCYSTRDAVVTAELAREALETD